jgi:glycosyltransferase involved in cell wall biosynthesis
MDVHRPRRTLAVVLKGYPRLSETFVAQELLALEQRGHALVLYSLRRPSDAAEHPIHAAIRAPVRYLPEYLHDEPLRVLRAWRRARRMRGYREARRTWWRDFRRDCSRNRLRRFGQALVLAAEMDDDAAHLYAHFMHTPASVARYAALVRGLAWSVSAHAKDIWTTPEWEKREKLASCALAVTCTAQNAAHLRALAGAPARVDLVYHGLDQQRFPPPPGRPAVRDGRDAGDPVRIVAIGRAVDKKGFDDLLRALARLPADVHWRLVHVGGGPLLPALRALAAELRIADRVAWRGAQAHDGVLAAYREADIFALPSRVSDDGDRDGLPNVLLEAQSQRLACVSTRMSGIPELIDDGASGVLVAPRDVDALARALERLIRDPAWREALGAAGFERTRRDFTLAAGADVISARLAAAYLDKSALTPDPSPATRERGAESALSPHAGRGSG